MVSRSVAVTFTWMVFVLSGPGLLIFFAFVVLQAPPPARSQTAEPAGSVTGGQ